MELWRSSPWTTWEFGERALPFYWAGFIMVGDGSGKIQVRQ